MQKSAFLFLLLLLSHAALYSQQDISMQNVIPPSPEATAIAKYGAYPIGSYTGRPDITIPIYEIKVGTMSVPITLSYDATGIRVNDMASWVGQNWSLNAGGMISQMVVGRPDINTSTGLDAVPPRAADIVNNTTYFDYLQSLVDGDMAAPAHPDPGPDKFFYSVNGKSGSFVLDRNRNILQIPKTSFKISITAPLAGTTPSFTIIDESGVTYIFSDLESTETYNYSYQGTSPNASASGSVYSKQNTAYYLSEMVSPEGEHIYFTYENGLTATRDDMYDESYGDNWTVNNTIPSKSNTHFYIWNGVQRVVTIPRLKTISFPNGKLEFSRVTDRQDDAGLTSASRLDEITVYQKNQKNANSYTKLRSFKFVQGYYYSTATYGQYSGIGNQTVDRYRLRLDELKIRDAEGDDVSSYQFKYNSTQPPPKTSCSQDWWGYYNGQYSNTTLVPTTTIPDGNGGSLSIGGADRSCDTGFMKAGILETIVYPTGGYTTFETEAHELLELYSNVSQSNSATALGQVSAENNVVSTFTTSSSVEAGSGTLNISISPYSGTDQMPFVKIKNVSTGQEQTYTAPGNTSGNSTWYSTVITYDFSANTTYQLTAFCYVNQANATANIDAAYTETVYNPHTVPVGGLRIQSIKNYNSDSTLAYEENYRYGENENGAGVYVGIPTNTYGYTRSITACIPLSDIVDGCGTASGSKSVFGGGALFDQALIQGSPVVYTSVAKYYGNPNSNSGKTVYNYGTADQQAVQTIPVELANNQGIAIINDTWKKGQLIYQDDFRRNADSTYTLVQESQNSYNIVYTDTTYGLLAQTKFDRQTLCSTCTPNFNDYAFADYPVYSGYVQLAQNVKNLYAQDGIAYIGTTTNYSYDPAHPDFNAGTTTVNSKGQTVEVTKKYPFNKTDLQATDVLTAAESTAIDSMVARNMLAPVMEEIEKIAGVQITRKRMQYEFVNSSIIAPVSLKFQTYANPIETRVQFVNYDNIGNILQQRKANDVNHAYIWDYEASYPIAEVVNADTGSIAYTSFEADGSGQWLIDPSARDTSTGFTGACSYILNNNVSRTGLSSSSAYIVSYWTLNAQPFSIAGTVSGYPTNGKTINGWTLYIHKVLGQSTISIVGSGHIDELRLYPATAQMTTYTYDPLVGMTSRTDPGNRVTYYEYDGLERLKRIRDQDYNILKTFDYQYQAVTGCGSGCYVLTMQTFTGSNTISYPVGVFNVNRKLLGNVTNADDYVAKWNSDTADNRIGTLSKGTDSMHFNIALNAGQSAPASVIGCRYYQWDLPYNKLDAIMLNSGAYVDYGDGTGMKLPKFFADSTGFAPNTTFPDAYIVHTYPDTSMKTITIYHNDADENIGLDNFANPATSLTKIRHLRGYFPQHTPWSKFSSMQQPGTLSFDSIYNWNSITSLLVLQFSTGDGGNNACENVKLAQDFMKNNRGLQQINTSYGYYTDPGVRDTTFKLSLLKTDWNTYFTQLNTLQISDDHWNREDLSGLKNLKQFYIAAGNHAGYSSFIPIPAAVSDNILNQIAAGAGQKVYNGVLSIFSDGGGRTSASNGALNLLLSKGWTILLDGVKQVSQ
jgi:YD repeat-containing protein